MGGNRRERPGARWVLCRNNVVWYGVVCAPSRQDGAAGRARGEAQALSRGMSLRARPRTASAFVLP